MTKKKRTSEINRRQNQERGGKCRVPHQATGKYEGPIAKGARVEKERRGKDHFGEGGFQKIPIV